MECSGPHDATLILIQVNSDSTLNFLCHDLMSEEYSETMEWLTLIQTSAPESETTVLLTKADDMNEGVRKNKTEKFCEGFGKIIEKAIDLTKQHMRASTGPNKILHEKHCKSLQHIKSQLDSEKIPCVSCVPGWEGTVSDVAKVLTEFAEKHKHLVMLRPIDKELFISIGKLGIREEMTLEFPQTQPYQENNPERKLASEEMANINQSKPTEMKMEREEKDNVLQSESTDTKETLRQQYVTFEEVQGIFRPILKKYFPDKEPQLKEELQKSLVNLKKRGLLAYFTGNKNLEDIIFNDISTMVNILRCIFHHRREEFLDFQNLDKELQIQLYEGKPTKYQAEVEELQRHGIISPSLIKVLLNKCNCSIDGEVVVDLLHHLNVAVILANEQCTGLKAFIPFFLEDVEADGNIEEKKEEISKCHNRVLSIHTILEARTGIPKPFFHQLLVKLFGKISEKHTIQKNNKAWKDGVSVSLGNHQAKLMMIYRSDKKIEFIIQANIQDQDGHRLIWENITFVDTESKDLKESKFPGLPLVYFLICTHCVIEDIENPGMWHIDILLKPYRESTFECEHATTGFTRTLVAPLSEGKFLIHFK